MTPGWGGGGVADCASSLQALTDTYKLMTGTAQILKGAAGLSGRVPLSASSAANLCHWGGGGCMARHTGLTPEILSY